MAEPSDKNGNIRFKKSTFFVEGHGDRIRVQRIESPEALGVPKSLLTASEPSKAAPIQAHPITDQQRFDRREHSHQAPFDVPSPVTPAPHVAHTEIPTPTRPALEMPSHLREALRRDLPMHQDGQPRPLPDISGTSISGHVFLSQVDAGGPLAGHTLGELGIVMQAAEDAAPKLLEKKPEGENYLRKSDYNGHNVVFWDGSYPIYPRPGRGVVARISCGKWLMVRRYNEFQLDVVIYQNEVRILHGNEFDEDERCKAANKKVPWSAKMNIAQQTDIANRIEDGSELTEPQGLLFECWYAVCNFTQEEAKNTILDKGGKKIPSPPPITQSDIICEAPCVPVWSYFCFPTFEEVGRWCEVGPEKDLGLDTGREVKIIARIEGKVAEQWWVKCTEIEGYGEILDFDDDERKTPVLPSDVRTRSHYVPKGVDHKTRPAEKPLPDGCCCLITGIRGNIEIIKNPGIYWGHRLTIEIDYIIKKKQDGDNDGDCFLRWWELTDKPPPNHVARFGVKPNEWYDGLVNVPASNTFLPWYHRDKKCDNKVKTVKLVDEPGTTWPLGVAENSDAGDLLHISRNLWIKVEAGSSCNDAVSSVCFFQHTRGGSESGKGWATLIAECDNLDPQGNKIPEVPEEVGKYNIDIPK